MHIHVNNMKFSARLSCVGRWSLLLLLVRVWWRLGLLAESLPGHSVLMAAVVVISALAVFSLAKLLWWRIYATA